MKIETKTDISRARLVHLGVGWYFRYCTGTSEVTLSLSSSEIGVELDELAHVLQRVLPEDQGLCGEVLVFRAGDFPRALIRLEDSKVVDWRAL